ncbi:MAG: hypothetical protein IPM53_00870 [Anaerolineaceae bacterium]|nr:hypothetical protein [Anaerolineaceae bacterium]
MQFFHVQQVVTAFVGGDALLYKQVGDGLPGGDNHRREEGLIRSADVMLLLDFLGSGDACGEHKVVLAQVIIGSNFAGTSFLYGYF